MEKQLEITDPINHPYMQKLQGTLSSHKKLLELLKKRIALINENKSTKTDYQINEDQITVFKTENEIATLSKIIKEKEDYFVKYMGQFVKDYEEVLANYTVVLEKAKQSDKEVLKNMLPTVDWKGVDNNIEARIELYKYIKKHL